MNRPMKIKMNYYRLSDLVRINSSFLHTSVESTSRLLADFPAAYKSSDVERGWYDTWEKNEYFIPRNNGKATFTMILPPPNVTGVLHLGHALTATVQDVLARWHRMKGDSVLWIPGLDHAGIATQAIVEKHLYKERGVARSNMKKEDFLSLVWKWKNEKSDVITSQLKTLGATLDWSREYFTMDKHHSIAVTEAFVRLNQRNILYREKDLINWCPALRSAISDIEVDMMEITQKTNLEIPGYKHKVTFGQIYELVFPVKDSKDQLFVATTRPETVTGDVAIAVHPEDERYNKYIGQYVWHPIRETFIPIIGDTLIKRDFGTGAMKVTPAHDHTDYIISKNHQLGIINAIDEQGNMTGAVTQFEGLPRFVAREKILSAFAEKGFLKNVKDHKMTLPMCSRSQDIIEYLLREQWFVRCKDMSSRALEAVRNGSLKLNPAIHEESWYNSLENVRDWCISRQLWWGHRIPAYCTKVNDRVEWIVAESEEAALKVAKEKYGDNVEMHQDEEVLDTWFSSSLLPLTALGWPNQTQEFKARYPLTLLETGHDILFFWVARMVMLGLELTNRLPFKEVLFHGVLCDGQGRKMSKSSGNVILPEHVVSGITLDKLNEHTNNSYNMGILSKAELQRTLKVNSKSFANGIPECGADALRMTLCSHNIKNRTVNFEVAECQTNKLFCNKIWQASKYTLLVADSIDYKVPEHFCIIDRWIQSRLAFMVRNVEDAFTNRNFHKGVVAIKQFLYYEFCDLYLEATKWGLKSEQIDIAKGHLYTLIMCLEVSLRIMAPITPYVADDLYTRLAKKLPRFLPVPSLLEAAYPKSSEFEILRDDSLDGNVDDVFQLILAIRALTANVSKKLNPEVRIVTNDTEASNFLNDTIALLRGGTRIFNITACSRSNFVNSENSIESSFIVFDQNCSVYLTVQDTAAMGQIKTNIQKRRQKIQKTLQDSLKFTNERSTV